MCFAKIEVRSFVSKADIASRAARVVNVNKFWILPIVSCFDLFLLLLFLFSVCIFFFCSCYTHQSLTCLCRLRFFFFEFCSLVLLMLLFCRLMWHSHKTAKFFLKKNYLSRTFVFHFLPNSLICIWMYRFCSSFCSWFLFKQALVYFKMIQLKIPLITLHITIDRHTNLLYCEIKRNKHLN